MASILVIDDSPPIRAAIEIMLNGAGHTVCAAPNGRDGTGLLRRRRFDLVVTDLLMPEGDGIEVIREASRVQDGIPVLAMSGGGILPRDRLLDMALALGAREILRKPFEEEEFLAAVERVLGPAA